VQPDEVYNLGAISFVQLSFKQPSSPRNHGSRVLRMLEAVRIVGHDNNPMRFYQAIVVGDVRQVQETPQTERTPFHPRSPTAPRRSSGTTPR